MAWKTYAVAQGDFMIDVDAIARIVRSAVKAEARNKVAREIADEPRQPSIVGGMPRIWTLEVDWKAVEAEARRVEFDMIVILGVASLNSDGVTIMMRFLRDQLFKTRKLNVAFAARQRDVSNRSRGEIEQSVAYYEQWINMMKKTRDLSASILLGAAAWATGGTALAIGGAAAATSTALGGIAVAGAGLKGVAKFQDNAGRMTLKQRYASATVEVSQNLLFVALPAARGVQLGQTAKMAKLLVSTMADGANAYAEGQSANGVATTAAVTLGVGLASNTAPLKKFFENTAIPVSMRLMPGSALASPALAVAANKKAAEDQIKKAIHGGIRSAMAKSLQDEAKSAAARVVADDGDMLSISDQRLLDLVAVKLDRDGAIMPPGWW